MSLINDALKKAQRQRTGDASPTSQPPMPGGAPLPARPSPARGGSSPQFLLVGAGAVLGLAIAGGAFFLFRSKTAAEKNAPAGSTLPIVAESAPAKTVDDSAAATKSSTPPPPAPSTKSPEPVVLAVKTEPPPAAPAAASTSSDAPAVAEKNVALPAAAPATSGEPPPPPLRMIESIEALRVAGIRVGAGTDAKVLMNDRVYRVGDTVDHALAIKLTGVTANSLTFRDATGATYTRNF